MSTFGKFSEETLLALHSRILAHEALVSSRANLSPRGNKVEGMDHDSSDVLEADAPRKGGLRQGSGPRFKAPATTAARASLLGLDKLAAQKRAEAGEPPSKRAKFEPEVKEEENGGVFKVPALPVRREARRVKPEETPSHGGGISDSARARLEEYRRSRNKPSTQVSASNERRDDRKERSLGDYQNYQSRLNKGSYHDDRDRDRRDDRYRRDDRDRRDRRDFDRRDDRHDDLDRRGGKSWDAEPTPRTSRPDRDGDGSLRVPNRGWDETPGRLGPGGWSKGGGSRRSWDQTPSRTPSRPDSPEFEVDSKEWEEEQVRIDRDWYSHDDEGAVVSLLR